MTHIKSGKKGENFPETHRVIMNFKGWLRGMHHHVFELGFKSHGNFCNIFKKSTGKTPEKFRIWIEQKNN